jgi:hypothetical protein
MAKHINTFNQGMDKDSSKHKYDNVHYFDGKNIRIVTQEGLTGGAVENMTGNKQHLDTFSNSTNNRVVGSYTLRDHVILWTTDNATSTPSPTSNDIIWKVPITDIETAITGDTNLFLNYNYFHSITPGHKIYEGNMELVQTNYIRAVGRYENEDVEKIYWVDTYNRLRHLNLVHDADINDLENLTVDKLEVIGNIDLSQPVIDDIVGGNLRAGKIQYAYQLYTISGSETVFSPTTGLIHLTSYSDTASGTGNYRGSDLDDPTGKAVQCSITVEQAGYTRMRIIAIQYTTLYGDPEIRIVDEREIAGTDNEVVTFIDTGESLGSYLLEDLRTLGTFLFSAKELETKDNILFPANITEESFNVDYDARAYRFGGASGTTTAKNYQETAANRVYARCYQEGSTDHIAIMGPSFHILYDNELNGPFIENEAISWSGGNGILIYLIDNGTTGEMAIRLQTGVEITDGQSMLGGTSGATADANGNPTGGKWWGSTIAGIPAEGMNWNTIPETLDMINLYNDISDSGNNTNRFMYQSDGVTLGGEGPNVTYEFQLKKMRIDEFSGETRDLSVAVEGTADNPSYRNYASPYNVAKYMGYHRDEVYRFGIVFFDEKGRSSFVKWIGDIRMPSISTLSDVVTYELTGTPTYQIGTISIVDTIAYETHYLDFGDEYFEYVVQPGDTAYDIGLALYNAILNGSSIATPSSLLGSGSFTLTFDKTPGSYVVYYDPSLDNYNQTQSYSTTATQYYDFSTAFHDNEVGGDGKVYTNVLYLYFRINNVPTEAVNYQIVRVKREANDRTIMAQGMLGPTIEPSASERTHGSFGLATGWFNEYTFASPEVAFNQNLVRQSNDELQEVGEFTTDVTTYTAGSLDVYKYTHITAMTNPQTPSGSAIAGDEHYTNSMSGIDNGFVMRQDETEASLGQWTYFTNNATSHTDKGVCFVLEAANTSWRSKNQAYNVGRRLMNYRRFIFNTQYGGLDYNARKRNTYIAAGKIQDANVINNYIFGGDTFIGMFDYLYSSWEQDSVTSTQPEAVYFPVESSINVSLRNDESYSRIYSNANAHLIHDAAGVWTNGTLEYAQSDPLYRYNSVYSKENDTYIFLTEPFDWNPQTVFDTRVYSSQIKTNNELSDSWLKFGVNAYKEVDPQYGEITALKLLNEQLLFFQPKAFGTLSINERALLQTGSIAQLSLGTSGVLDRYDYAKIGIGASSHRHITLTQNGLYWVDVINEAMYKYTSGVEELSMMKGMDSWFRENIDSAANMMLYRNPEFHEVYITDSTNAWTLIYNEVTDGFISFLDVTVHPTFAINYNDRLLTAIDNVNFYVHDAPNAYRGDWYGTNRDSYITLLVNPLQGDIMVLTNLEWLTEVYTAAGDEQSTKTYETIGIGNGYQHTGVVTLVSGQNMRRRGRKWRFTVPRAVFYEDGGTPLPIPDARMRDSYALVTLRMDSFAGAKFVAHDLTTMFVPSNK